MSNHNPENQFEKGCKPGPGRPPGKKNFRTLLLEKLRALDPDTHKEAREVLIDALIQGSYKLNAVAVRAILERIDPVVQQLQVEPIKIEVVYVDGSEDGEDENKSNGSTT
jgi:hypothetical protein